ncbi:MAG TPA: ROK family protein [Fimbriimonadaceae bacterium]|nr:ROK family protein [Fimbriimonadaceae bacterium]
MPGRCVVGVDLGGTNVRASAYWEDGSSAGGKFSLPSRAQDGLEATVSAIAEVIHQAAASAGERIEAIGLAIPGHVQDRTGLVRWAPNFGSVDSAGVFRNWVNIPLRDLLKEKTPAPIVTGNDANLAALGEYRFGTGRNSAKCLVMLTIGTGIGGGVVMLPESVGGKAEGPLLLLGANSGGAELGHMVIHAGGLDCNAGSYGAIEAYCQRDSIVARAVHRLKRGRKSLVNDLVGGDLSKVSPKILTDAADQGDELAQEVWAEVGTYLGYGIANCINVFAPDVMPIGGQIAKAGEWLLGPARRAARNAAIPSLFEDVNIVQAEQIEDAGMMGGAALALESTRWS